MPVQNFHSLAAALLSLFPSFSYEQRTLNNFSIVKVREAVVGPMSADFTGVTCLMGASAVPRPVRGICFPSSSTTKSHACYYPSDDNETVFQLYFPAKTIGEDWGPQSSDAWKKQQKDLVDMLRADGYVVPAPG